MTLIDWLFGPGYFWYIVGAFIWGWYEPLITGKKVAWIGFSITLTILVLYLAEGLHNAS